MRSNIQKQLLLGAAVTTLSFSLTAGASAQTVDLTGDSTYGTTVPVDAPSAGVNINLQGSNLSINTTNNTAIGAITDNATVRDGNVSITTDTNADITQTIGSVDIGGDLSVTGDDADNSAIGVTVTGATTVGGDLSVTTDEADVTDAVTLTLGGNAVVSGTTLIDAGDTLESYATLNVDGASNTFTGLVTVTGGGSIDADSSLIISGAETTFTNGVTLTSGAGDAILAADGTVAQIVSGNIGGDGNILITNTHASGVTFRGDITTTGMVIVNNDGEDIAAAFEGDVAADVVLGDNSGTDTVRATFGGTAPSVITGNISGGGAADTVALVFAGGSTVQTTQAITTDIDTITVSGNTTLDADMALTAGTITINSGSTLDAGSTLTAASGIVNNGTLVTGTATHQANITGTGLLDVNGTTQVNGSITQGSADIAIAGELVQIAANGYTVGQTNFSGDGALALASGNQTIAGNFTNTTDGEGNITIADGAGTTAFTGNIGYSEDHSLGSLTIAGAASQTVTTTRNLFVDAITLGGSDILQLIGTTAQVISGSLMGGDLIIGDGSSDTNATFNGMVASENITVDGGASATFNGDVEVMNDLIIGDTLATAAAFFNGNTIVNGATMIDGAAEFGNSNATTPNTLTGLVTAGNHYASTITLAGKTDVNGGLTIGAQGLNLLIKKTDDFDAADADGNGVANQGTDVVLDASGTAFNRSSGGILTVGISENTQELETGSEIHVVADDGTGDFAAGLMDGSIVLQSSAFVSLVDNGSDAGNLRVSVANNDAVDVLGEDAVGVNAADVLMNMTDAETTGELEIVKGRLQGARTAEDAREIAESIAPTVDAGAVVGTTTFVGQTASLTNTRLASLRDGGETGMVAGNVSNGVGAWVQGFGTTGDQSARDGVDGYDVETLGMAVGMDTAAIAENWLVGLGFAFANTAVDSDNANTTETDIDSYQITLYSNYDIDERTYLSSQFGYVWSENQQTRHDIGGVSGLNADADYDSDVIAARLELGRSYAAGQVTTLTPKILVNYQHYSADGYTETGAGTAGLEVESQSMDLLEIGVGMDAKWDFQQADGSYIQPKIGAGVRHDLIGDEYATTSSFTGGGPSFETNGFEPAQTTFNVGAGLTYFSTTNWDLSAAYDYEMKSDYDAHSGTLRAAYKF